MITDQMKKIADVAATGIITALAIVVGGAYMLDRGTSPPPRQADFVETWQSDNRSGIWVGPAEARVVITEFIDFECPYCAAIAPRTDSILADFPGDVALVVQHFPLEFHEYAVPTAIAAECADQQGKFYEMYLALLGDQAGFGARPWADYAMSAGVEDKEAFGACMRLPAESFPRIQAGIDLAERTGVRGTPTVWINGRTAPLHWLTVESLLDGGSAAR